MVVCALYPVIAFRATFHLTNDKGNHKVETSKEIPIDMLKSSGEYRVEICYTSIVALCKALLT